MINLKMQQPMHHQRIKGLLSRIMMTISSTKAIFKNLLHHKNLSKISTIKKQKGSNHQIKIKTKMPNSNPNFSKLKDKKKHKRNRIMTFLKIKNLGKSLKKHLQLKMISNLMTLSNK